MMYYLFLSRQKVAYTIEIEDINTGEFEVQGPLNFYHMGPKLLVIQNVISATLHSMQSEGTGFTQFEGLTIIS